MMGQGIVATNPSQGIASCAQGIFEGMLMPIFICLLSALPRLSVQLYACMHACMQYKIQVCVANRSASPPLSSAKKTRELDEVASDERERMRAYALDRFREVRRFGC